MPLLYAMAAATGFQPLVPLNPKRWLTDNDYPPSLMEKNIHGVTKFRLVVSSKGSPINCTVTTSSENAILDALTCYILMKRSKFEAARDRGGNAINGVFNSAARWQLPNGGDPETPPDIELSVKKLPKKFPAAPVVDLALLISADGIVEDCLPQENKKYFTALGLVACQQAKAIWKPLILFDESKSPIRSVQTITVRFSSDSKKAKKR